jgi:hypothetical protein
MSAAALEQAMAHQRAGRLAEALALLEQQGQGAADGAALAFWRAGLQQQLGQLEAAVASYRQALHLRPGWSQAHTNLGVALMDLQAHGASEQELRRALALEPGQAEALLNLGNVLWRQGRLGEAEQAYGAALERRPEYARAHHNRGMLQLLRGEAGLGWQGYGWRFRANPGLLPGIQLPPWQGQLEGTAELLLVQEQGLGDVLQFVRYAQLLRGRVGRLSLAVEPKLVPLLTQAALVDAVHPFPVAEGAVDPHCRWMPLLSAAPLLGATPQRPLLQAPYLRLDPQRLQHWRGLLPPGPLRLGLHWQGNPEHETGLSRGRSLPLELMAPLAALPGVELVALQKGPGMEQLASCSFRGAFSPVQAQVDQAWDFRDTAAIAACCDLVISNDTALAHLAGGLGLPLWILLQAVPEWRWGLQGSHCPWYPSARLFRQSRGGDWPAVITAVRDALFTLFPLDRR